MFPEEAMHCVEWARDKFGHLFTSKPKSLIASIDNPENIESKHLLTAISMLKKRPNSFTDCLLFARKKFDSYFSHNIQ